MKTVVYVLTNNGQARITCHAMALGVSACGDLVEVLTEKDYAPHHVEKYDAAIFWGYVETMQKIMGDFNQHKKPAVYLDLAYWERGTHYKVAVGARHSTEYFQRIKHDDTRVKRWGIELDPDWNDDGYILVAGMGPKAAWAEKLEPVESWERNVIQQLRRQTQREIVYRPKPSQHYGHPVEGATLDVTTPVSVALKNSWAVVTHHSNVAVEGLVAGVPAFAWNGLAMTLGLQDIKCIEVPYYPNLDDRQQWLNDVSYCQWSVDEMKDGTCWRHLKSEGLVR